MSFQTNIEDITGSISGKTAQAARYLAEGVKFITKYVMNNPDMEQRLTQVATLNTSSSTLSTTNILHIASVTRSDATRFREASEIPVENAADYSDANSIYVTSKFDPVYYIDEDVLHIIPTPSNSETAKVRHITPDTSVAVGDSSIDNFPPELERGVVLYASKEILRLFMNDRNATLVSLSPGDIDPPSVSIDTVTYSAPGNSDVGDSTAGSVSASTAVTAGDKITFGPVPSYSKQSSGLDHDAGSIAVNDFLSSEDVELAQIALQKEQQKLTEHSSNIQDELNEFNKEVTIYQADIQAALDKAQRDLQALINKARNDLEAAQSTAQLATNVSIQNQSEKSQRLIQNAINTMQALVRTNDAKIAAYNADINNYTAKVNEEVQRYTLAFQEVVQDYNWYSQQYQLATQDLFLFLQPYITLGVPNEVAADDRAS